MYCSWDPLTLEFSNTRLESQFKEYVAEHSYASIDRTFAASTLCLNVVTILVILWQRRPNFVPAAICNCLAGIFVLRALEKYPVFYYKHRTSIVLILRTIRMASCIYGFLYQHEHEDVWYMVVFARMIAFALMCVYYSCGMPLNFKVTF